MKRLFFTGKSVSRAAAAIFGGEKDFSPEKYAAYEEIELVVQEDGRFSVWGNLTDDAYLLRDTRRDTSGMAAKLLPLADNVVEEQ